MTPNASPKRAGPEALRAERAKVYIPAGVIAGFSNTIKLLYWNPNAVAADPKNAAVKREFHPPRAVNYLLIRGEKPPLRSFPTRFVLISS